ncbi:MAG: relaxase/mobilization nuclease domain-containing protein [Eubacterium sp.]|nr:relaxase/mobilization nuclease domain-containing protein [Eubacterium sp.]
MAVTKIIKIKASVESCIDYATNSLKTNNGELVKCIGCELGSAKYSFLTALSNNDYHKSHKDSELVKAYHIIQSFSNDDKITPKEANAIGLEMMERMFGGKYIFICATHTDKGHIHNHIIVSSVESARTGKMINDDLSLLHKLRRTSDQLCREHGLNVIEKPKGRGKSYKEWFEDTNNPKGSKKQQLRDLIDSQIKLSSDFDDFLNHMMEAGAKIETRTSHKYGQVTKYKLPEASENDHWNRGYRLGSGYSNQMITKRIERRIKFEADREALKKERAEANKARRDSMSKAEKAIDRTQLKISSIVDTSKMEITSENYKKIMWYNKQNAMLAERIKGEIKKKYGVSYTEIKSKISKFTAENKRIAQEIRDYKEPIQELRKLIENCQIYIDTFKINERYEASKDPERYYENHDIALNAFAAAEDYLSRKGFDTSFLRDKEKSEKFMTSLRNRLEAAEDTVLTAEEEINKNEKAIAELRKAQKNLDKFHKKNRDEI